MFDLGNARILGDREKQEDYFASLPMNNGLLCIVADGMGGYEGGEIASSLSVKSFIQFFKENFREDKIPELLILATDYANETLAQEKEQDSALAEMGNTLVATYTDKKTLYWVNVGDSILYRYRDAKLVRISADHSVAGELQAKVEEGQISQKEANESPNRYVLTSALTGYEIPHIEQSTIEMEDRDVFILASDGLHTLSERHIENIVSEHSNSQEIADRLLEMIEKKETENQDNTTVIVFKKETLETPTLSVENLFEDLEDEPTLAKTTEEETFKPNKRNTLWVSLVLIMVTLFIVLVVYFNSIKNRETMRLNLNDENISRTIKLTTHEHNNT